MKVQILLFRVSRSVYYILGKGMYSYQIYPKLCEKNREITSSLKGFAKNAQRSQDVYQR